MLTILYHRFSQAYKDSSFNALVHQDTYINSELSSPHPNNSHGTIIWPVDRGDMPDAPSSVSESSTATPLSWSPISESQLRRTKVDEGDSDEDACESGLQESGMVSIAHIGSEFIRAYCLWFLLFP
mgnify:FL=1